jgi:hypothetical protein
MASVVFQLFGVPTPAIESILTRLRTWNSICGQDTVTPQDMLAGLMTHLETTGRHKECAKAMAPLWQLGL